jgi:hypothetical protein
MSFKPPDHTHGTGHDKPPRSDFLFPLRLPIARFQPDPLLARLFQGMTGRTRIPFDTAGPGAVVGSFGGPRPGSGPSGPDDESTPLPAHLLVIFALQKMENVAVSGGGVAATCFATWETHSSEATDESGGPFSLPVPLPGDVWWVPNHAAGIYQGVVINGCGHIPVFPVTFDSTVGEQEDILSPFNLLATYHKVDNSTIHPNGFWTFAYTIRATGTNGGVSDFKFSGIVSVTCSIQNSL